MRARGAAVLAVLLALLPSVGNAQVSVVAGGAASIPVADLGDVADLGYQGTLGGTLELGSGGAVLGLVGFYGRNPHRLDGDRSEIYGAAGLAGYRLIATPGVRVTPWLGLGGAVHRRHSDTYPGLRASRRGLTVHAGATVSRPVGRVAVSVSAFYVQGLGSLGTRTFPTQLVTVGAGVEIPLSLD